MVNPFLVGADDYISKPFDGIDLLERLQGNLVKNRTLLALKPRLVFIRLCLKSPTRSFRASIPV